MGKETGRRGRRGAAAGDFDGEKTQRPSAPIRDGSHPHGILLVSEQNDVVAVVLGYPAIAGKWVVAVDGGGDAGNMGMGIPVADERRSCSSWDTGLAWPWDTGWVSGSKLAADGLARRWAGVEDSASSQARARNVQRSTAFCVGFFLGGIFIFFFCCTKYFKWLDLFAKEFPSPYKSKKTQVGFYRNTTQKTVGSKVAKKNMWNVNDLFGKE